MTHPSEVIGYSLELGRQGRSRTEISRLVGLPRATVRDWLHGQVPRPRVIAPGMSAVCGAAHDLATLPTAYVHLLALYLGDGCLSRQPRGVFKLRISLDAR